MEWGRAKTILILAFLGLNLVLGYQLWVVKKDVLGTQLHSPEVTQQTEALLEAKSVTVLGDIPQQTPKAGEITVRFSDQEDQLGDAMLRLPVEERVLMEQMEQDLIKHVQGMDQYERDAVMDEEGILMYNQLFEGLPMFEVNLKLYKENDEIYGYAQQYVEVLPGDSEKNQTVLSAYTALQLLAENYLVPGTVVEDIRLGYHGKIYNSDTQVMAPKWRFTLEDGTIYYLHAINGEVEEVAR
ncbi:two-component system regulatory protein YycI [Marinicrinis sediminis]|uniref:Two-component system regulatory protein YycI n=1 Tax=Marinicrinis sediminis TaxID=1652465 RepID=A0ABW5RDP4_9BACL